MRTFLLAVTMLAAMPAEAADVAMRRVLACVGPDARIEVYVPQSVVTGTGAQNARLDAQVTGAYSLDLTDAGKGKMLEPVRVRYSKDHKTVIVDQYTRKLPPTAIPGAGGTVDFDQRFATGAKCGPFNED
jgi:hypothetical protein